jgi:hypothetical protein
MLKLLLAASFAALVAATPLAATAQTAAAPGAHPHSVHRPTGSYRSEMRRRHNTSKDRARASAEHMRKLHAQ